MKWNDIPGESLSIIDNVGDISGQGYHSLIVYSCDSFSNISINIFSLANQTDIWRYGTNGSK